MLVLRKNKRKIFAAAAAALILVLSIVPAFADVVNQPVYDDEGHLVQLPARFIIPAGCYFGGTYYQNASTVNIGNIEVNSRHSLYYGQISKPGYFLSYYRLSCYYAALDDQGHMTAQEVFIQNVYGEPLYFDQSMFSVAESYDAFEFIVEPIFEEGYAEGEEDDEYHSAAFIRVLNSLWQGFYSSFLSLTNQMSIFGISLISIISALVLVVVVYTIIKIIRGH